MVQVAGVEHGDAHTWRPCGNAPCRSGVDAVGRRRGCTEIPLIRRVVGVVRHRQRVHAAVGFGGQHIGLRCEIGDQRGHLHRVGDMSEFHDAPLAV